MSVIWLDITTIFGWHRPAVGIVRVESECATYALKQSTTTHRFCRFDTVERRYLEVTAEEVYNILERIQSYKTTGNVLNDTTIIVKTPIEQWAKSGIHKIIGVMPTKWRGKVFSFIAARKNSFHAAVRSYREARLAVNEFARPSNQSIQYFPTKKNENFKTYVVPFGKNDVYVSVGLDWDQKDLGYLYAQKKLVDFKVLLFCYDIIPVKFPHLCVGDVAAKFAKYFSDVAWSADRILCISECSRRDLDKLLRDLGAPVPDMGIIKLGCDLGAPEVTDVATSISNILEQKYILYVSTIERRKNHETLYRAYTRLIDAGKSSLPLLVFVGMPGWGVNDLINDLKLDPRIQPYIRILNHVSDGDLVRLYKNALFTVYPSLYEGWGLPVAESLAHGKYCLASNAASIPEVGGDLIEYIDPWNVPEWASRLEWYIDNPNHVENKEAEIRSKYQPTRWDETGANIFAIASLLGRAG